MKVVIILCLCISFGFSEILSLSPKEKRAMKNDYKVLNNAYNRGYTEHFIEFAEKFLEQYKLASVEKDESFRKLYNSVKIAMESIKSDNNIVTLEKVELQDNIIKDDEEIQKLFSAVLLGTAEDIIYFAEKYPDFRPKDIYGALERARVNDLSAIFASIERSSIPTNEIIRFAEIYGDTIAIKRIKTSAEKLVLKNTNLLRDFRKVFGITDFDEKVEQILYNKIMYENEYKNLIFYIEYFPEGKYIKFVTELVNNYR